MFRAHTGDTTDLAEVQLQSEVHTALREAGLQPGTAAYNQAYAAAMGQLDELTQFEDWGDYL